MMKHRVKLTETVNLVINLPETWKQVEHEEFAGLFAADSRPGEFQPNITVTVNPYEEEGEPTAETLKRLVLKDYKTLLGHKILGSQKIKFLEGEGFRVESLLIADNGLRIVQAARLGTITHEGEKYLVQVSGVCTKSTSPLLLPQIRETLKTMKTSIRIPDGESLSSNI